MSGDPYRRATLRQARNRRRADGWAAAIAPVAGPAIAIALLVPLLRPVFLAWLDHAPETWADGMAATALRGGLFVAALLSLDVYGALIRGPDRAVLALLPVDPHAVVRQSVRDVAWRRWWLLPGAAAVLAPAAVAGAVDLWALGMLVIAGAWLLGLALSAWVHLRAVDVAEDPSWGRLLDNVRGSNPREQAAFLYAPGLVLLASGVLIQAACAGLVAAAHAQPEAIALIAPFPIAATAWIGLRARAPSWFAASAVLAEIDGRYAALLGPEEARHVYLDWTVRWLPRGLGTWVLKDLRHGWRARRTWVTGAWLAGVGALAAGWTGSELGPVRAADVALAAAWLFAAVGVVLEADEPAFLRAWLPGPPGTRAAARLIVLILWLQPPTWLGAAAVLVRRGVADAIGVLAIGLVSSAIAAVTAVACGALGRRGLGIYAPLGAVAAAIGAAWVGA